MKLECPHCAAVLRTSQPLRQGKRVSCARCGQGFLFPGDTEPPSQANVAYRPIILSSSPPSRHSQPPLEPPAPPSDLAQAPGNYDFADDENMDQHYGPDRRMQMPDGEIVYGFSMASNPIGASVSREKLKIIVPQLFGIFGGINKLINRCVTDVSLFDQLQMCLTNGDSRAAVVLTIEPLRVAAYTDEFDCVIILRFSDKVDNHYRLERGDRLLTINTYAPPGTMKRPKDITPGDHYRGTEWVNVFCFIADFLTDDMDIVERRKREISEDEWKRTELLGKERLYKKPKRARDGNPFWNGDSAFRWE